MDYLQSIIFPYLIFYNPIATQFNLLCDKVIYNLCLVDTVKRQAFVSLYIYRLTGKTNGFYTDLGSLNNALRFYCSNKPIVIVLIDYVGNFIEIQQDT